MGLRKRWQVDDGITHVIESIGEECHRHVGYHLEDFRVAVASVADRGEILITDPSRCFENPQGKIDGRLLVLFVDVPLGECREVVDRDAIGQGGMSMSCSAVVTLIPARDGDCNFFADARRELPSGEGGRESGITVENGRGVGQGGEEVQVSPELGPVAFENLPGLSGSLFGIDGLDAWLVESFVHGLIWFDWFYLDWLTHSWVT